jgi:hypothetical protein
MAYPTCRLTHLCLGRQPDKHVWDYEWGQRESLETSCGSCDQPIVIHRVLDVTYSVSVLEEEKPQP